MVVLCPRHRLLLQDRCGHCASPYMPHRSDIGFRRAVPINVSMLVCSACGRHVEGNPIPAQPGDISLQLRINSCIDSGIAFLDESPPIYSHLFFDGLRLIIKTIVVPSRVGAGWNQPEKASCSDRLEMLHEAFCLLDRWPHALLERCSTVRHAYSRFTRDGDAVPFWLYTILRENFFRVPSPTRQNEPA